MNEFLKKINNLSPEKQAELLAKLKKSKNNVVKDKIDFTKNFQYSNNSDKPFDFSLLQTEVSDPGPNHVQIRAKASSLNFRDVMIAFKKYPIFPGIPTNMGSDYAGIIEKVALSTNSYLVDLSHLPLLEPENYAKNEKNYNGNKTVWKVDGIGIHPGDLGMENISNQIFLTINAAFSDISN